MGNSSLGGTFRAIVATGLGYAAGKGYIPAGDYSFVAAALSTVGVAIWSIFAKQAPPSA
jgi:hypothetical protein